MQRLELVALVMSLGFAVGRHVRDARVMTPFLLALLVGCAPTAMTVPPDHPANPDAPAGRLAGPPAALRPGVADVSTPSMPPSSAHAGHDATAPATTDPAKPDETGKPESEPEPTSAQSSSTKPAKKPRKQTRPPASKQTPGKTSTDKPQPTPPAHQGHEGHH